MCFFFQVKQSANPSGRLLFFLVGEWDILDFSGFVHGFEMSLNVFSPTVFSKTSPDFFFAKSFRDPIPLLHIPKAFSSRLKAYLCSVVEP